MRHAQTLDERGRRWRHGRWWWGPTRCEWTVGPSRWGTLGLSFALEREALWHIGIPWFSVYFSVVVPSWLCERLLPWHYSQYSDRQFKITEERQLSISWHGGGLWWSLWMAADEWKSTDSRWRRGHFDPARFVFGQPQYMQRVIATERVLIPMPEKSYPATVELREDSWKRPRWPFTRYVRRADTTPDEGIPFQGKGENSWDCGDDGLYGQECPARSVEEAVGKVVESVYGSRRKYGICAPEHAIKASERGLTQ